MASVGLLEIFLALALALIFICLIIVLGSNKNELPTNWPVVGMLPELLLHANRDFYEWITKILLKAQCNFLVKGPWFSNMKPFFTSDPANIHYILSSNFVNFHKGTEFKSIFDGLGDGIFNSDSDQWREQRKIAKALITHKTFHKFLVRTTMDKVHNGLLSVLNYTSEKGSVVDLQDVFQRFAFDSTCKLVTGFDSGCLSTDFPKIPFAIAADDAEHAVFLRHLLPEFVWKLQRWLGVGEEKKHSKCTETSDLIIIAKYIEEKREQMRKGEKLPHHDDEEGTDLLTSYIHLGFDDNRFLRDTILNFFFAGRGTIGSALTWFFWNVSQHPSVEKKIREEITSAATTEEIGSVDFINKLVYLHAAICESLRLYPPVPWNHKRAIKPDILPSGHHVDSSVAILFSLYTMGRTPFTWGEDCLEFRPERWITDKGEMKHEPSYKFLAFNAGPRTCLGKNMSFTQIKIIVVNIIQKFDIEVVEGQDVNPRPSVILHMNKGLKVKVAKRSTAPHQVNVLH